MNTRWINAAVYLLCMAAPWSLLWLDSSLLFPYTTGKTWVFRSLVEVAFALALASRLIDPVQAVSRLRFERPAGIFILILLLFIGWSIVSTALGIDPYRSFWSNWERMGGVLDYLHWAAYLYCLLWVLDREKNRYLLLNLVLVISVAGFIGMLDDGENRSISTLGNPIYLGNLAVLGLFVSAWLLTENRFFQGWKVRVVHVLLLVAMAIMIIALFKSASRGPMVALLAGGLMALISLGLEHARRRGQAAIMLVVAGMLLASVVLFTQFNTFQQALKKSDIRLLQRIGEISLSNQTTADRLENWRIALEAVDQHPATGWGQENYMIAFNEHYHPGVMDNAQIWFDRAHNAYLDQLVATGFPGLLLYLLMLGMPVFLVWKLPEANSLQKSLLTGLFTAYMVKNLVGFDIFSSIMVWVIMLAVVLAELRKNDDAKQGRARAYMESTPVAKRIIPVLLVVAIFSVYWLNIRSYQENRRFAALMSHPQALRSSQLGEILVQPVDRLRYAQNAKLAVFDRVLVAAFKRKPKGREALRYRETLELAGKLIDDELARQPRNYRVRYNGALMYARLGHLERAAQMLEELTRMAPERTIYWYMLGQVESARGNKQAADRARREVKRLNPGWKP